MVHACNPVIREAEAGDYWEFEASLDNSMYIDSLDSLASAM